VKFAEDSRPSYGEGAEPKEQEMQAKAGRILKLSGHIQQTDTPLERVLNWRHRRRKARYRSSQIDDANTIAELKLSGKRTEISWLSLGEVFFVWFSLKV